MHHKLFISKPNKIKDLTATLSSVSWGQFEILNRGKFYHSYAGLSANWVLLNCSDQIKMPVFGHLTNWKQCSDLERETFQIMLLWKIEATHIELRHTFVHRASCFDNVLLIVWQDQGWKKDFYDVQNLEGLKW